MGKRTNTAVWLEKYNRWQIKVQKDGIRKTFTSSKAGRTGQREANKKADEWLDEGITDTSKKVSFFFENWLDEVKANTGTSNHRKYKSYYDNWIKNQIGNTKIGSLTDQNLQNIINSMNKAKLSKKTQKCMKGCLSSFLKFCRKSKVTNLTAEWIEIPRNATVNEKRILQPHELKILFNSAESTYNKKSVEDFYINAYRFQTVTGLRPGEVLGLKWGDLKDNSLSIRRSYNYEGEYTKGKNENAVRNIELTPTALGILTQQKKALRKAGLITGLIFPNTDGSVIEQRVYYACFIRYCKHNGISPISPYELRHTFVSVSKSIPKSLLQSYVGHSKDMDTLGVYGHEVSGEQKEAAVKIEEAFRKILNA